MRILHFITGVNVGGAETMLAKLLEYQASAMPFWRSQVVSLAPPGAIAPRIAGCADLQTLGLREGRVMAGPATLARVDRITRGWDPDLVVGWMHHGNLAAWLAARRSPRKAPLIWNIRHSVADIRDEKLATRLVLRLGAMVSRCPAAIVYNAQAAVGQYRVMGYDSARALVIPNGFDCALYRPRPEMRQALRRRFRIADRATLVGMIARQHPMKDPAMLVEAVRRARRGGADIHLLLAGQGMDDPPPDLARALADLPPDRVTLLGQRQDLPDLMPGLDILALPSAWGEGFPNTLAEAMACGLPCIATDVGDSRDMLGPTGRVVPPRDAGAMAAALADFVAMDMDGRLRIGRLARQRVCENYAIADVGARFTMLHRDVQRNGLATATGGRPSVAAPVRGAAP